MTLQTRRLLARLLDALRAEGYPLGPGKLLQVEELLRQLPPETGPAALRTQLAPLFTSTAEQQARFYERFDQLLAQLRAEEAAEETPGAPPPEPPEVQAAQRAETRWRRAALGGLLALVALAGFLADPDWWPTWTGLAGALLAAGVAGWKLTRNKRARLGYLALLPLLAAAGFGLKVGVTPAEVTQMENYLPRTQRLQVEQGQTEIRNIQPAGDTAVLQAAAFCDGQTAGELPDGSRYALDSLGRFTFTAAAEAEVATTDSLCAEAVYAGRRDTVYFIVDILPKQEEAAADTGLIAAMPIPFPRTLPDAGPEESGLLDIYRQWQWPFKALLWLLLAGIAWALVRWYERRRARVVAEIEQRDQAPYVWRIETGEEMEVDFGENMALLLNRLRRREGGEGQRLDAPATVQATVRKAGQVSFIYRQPTRPPEYLLLIDRYDANDHRARLFDTLYGELKEAEVYIERYFYQGDPRHCFNETHPSGVSLTELLHRHRDARLLLVGEGRRLLSPTDGQPLAWTNLFEGWRRRALLLTSPTNTWGRREDRLGGLFPLAPATLQGLDLLLEQFETLEQRSPREVVERITDTVSDPLEFRGSLFGTLRRYYHEDLIRWIAACAVYPALHWDLTLHLGRELSTEEAPLLTSDNLRQLARLPWFIEGRMPEGAREQLLDYLAEDGLEKRVRRALDDLLRQTRPPEGSVAYDDFRMNVVLNRLLLDPPAAERRALEREFERYLAAGKQPDFVTFKLLERQATRLDLLAPEGLKRLLFRHGQLRFGWRPRPLLWGLWGLLAGVIAFMPVPDNICEGELVTYEDQTLCLDSPEDRLIYLELLTREAIGAQQHERVDSLRAAAAELGLGDPSDFGPALSSDETEANPVDLSTYYRNVAADYFNYGARAYNCTLEEAGDCQDVPADSLLALSCFNFQRGDTLWRAVSGGRSFNFSKAMGKACVADADEKDLDTPAEYTFTGRVLDDANGQPIAGAAISAGDARATTGASGRYEITLPAEAVGAELSLRVTAENYQTADLSFPPRDPLPTVRLSAVGPAEDEVVLPQNESINLADVKRRNMLGVLVNAQNQLLVREEPLRLEDLRETAKQFIANPLRRPDYAERPPSAIILLGNDPGTNYAAYLEVFNELKAAYDELWDEQSLRRYGVSYASLSQEDRRRSIQEEIPRNLIEVSRAEFDSLSLPPPAPPPPVIEEVPEEEILDEEDQPERVIEPAMVRVPGGEFTMGCLDGRDTDCGDDEKPAHPVTVKDFRIGRYEVTNEEFVAFLNDISSDISIDENGDEVTYKENVIFDIFCGTEKGGCSGFQERMAYDNGQQAGGRFTVVSGFEKHPVVLVSFYGAEEYCRWLREKTGRNYRLPTEAEWEYAARGGQAGKENNFLYSGSNNVNEVAWYSENSSRSTHPVGQKKPNELGLYDMSGNVYEWCRDVWHDSYEGAPADGSAWLSGGEQGRRVVRGGSWGDVARVCRASVRFRGLPDSRSISGGFRVAQD